MADQTDRRYDVGDLAVGWQFRSPAGRVETIERIEADPEPATHLRVWTQETGPEYAWRLRTWDKVHAVPPIGGGSGAPEIRIVELPRSYGGGRLTAVITTEHVEIPDMARVLVEASPLPGTGAGWEMRDRPAGGDLVITRWASKAAARTALRAAAKAHARALKVPVRVDGGRS